MLLVWSGTREARCSEYYAIDGMVSNLVNPVIASNWSW